MMDSNKKNATKMWKTLKEIIKGNDNESCKLNDIEFEGIQRERSDELNK